MNKNTGLRKVNTGEPSAVDKDEHEGWIQAANYNRESQPQCP